jgi:hypothetical protein
MKKARLTIKFEAGWYGCPPPNTRTDGRLRQYKIKLEEIQNYTLMSVADARIMILFIFFQTQT